MGCWRCAACVHCNLCSAQANGLNVSRVFLYNLDYGPTSQVPQYAPTPPSVPSVQVSGPNPRGAPVGLAPAPAPTAAVLPAGGAAASAAAPAEAAPAQTAGPPESNAALIGGQHRSTFLHSYLRLLTSAWRA